MENLEKSEKIEKTETRTEYRFKQIACTVTECSYEEGELRTIISLSEWTLVKSAPTLLELITNFLSQEVHCHKQDMCEFVFDPDIHNRIELVVYGLPTDDCIFFLEPREQDWEDYKNGKENLWCFTFDLRIEKCVVTITHDLIQEFNEIGIKESM